MSARFTHCFVLASIVLAGVLTLPAYGNHHGRHGDRMHARNNNNNDITRNEARQIIHALYEGVLFRAPEPAGMRYYMEKLLNGGYNRLVNEVAAGFGNSPEFQNDILYYYDAEEVVENMYYYLLGRWPTWQEARPWVRMIDRGRGADVVVRLVGSREFYNYHLGY